MPSGPAGAAGADSAAGAGSAAASARIFASASAISPGVHRSSPDFVTPSVISMRYSNSCWP